jgi:hypothetical protein
MAQNKLMMKRMMKMLKKTKEMMMMVIWDLIGKMT